MLTTEPYPIDVSELLAVRRDRDRVADAYELARRSGDDVAAARALFRFAELTTLLDEMFAGSMV